MVLQVAMFGEKGIGLAPLFIRSIDTCASLLEQRLECNEDDLVLDDELGHGSAHHNHDTTVGQVSVGKRAGRNDLRPK